MVSNTVQSGRSVKFESDVAVLNKAVKLYRASGGKFDADWGEAEVIDALKAHAAETMQRRVVGLSSHLVDLRLGIEMGEGNSQRKAIWSSSQQQFEIHTTANKGIIAFNLYEENAPGVVKSDNRASAVLYASKGNWVWDYKDHPESTPTLTPPDTGIPGAPGIPPGDPLGTTPLTTPILSHPAGSYDFSDFDLPVVISTTNPAGSSEIYYRLGSGEYTIYAGGPITIAEGVTLYAFAKSIDPDRFTDSPPTLADYSINSVPLQAPIISVNYPHFDRVDHPRLTVSISDPNEPHLPRSVRYRIDAGSWIDYAGSFDLLASDYPRGADVEAMVLSGAEWVIDSPSDFELLRVKLQPPTFEVTNPDEVLADVVVNDPNPSGTSSVYYQFGELPTPSLGAATEYANPLSFSGSTYPNGVRLSAFAKGTSDRYLDSEMAAVDIELVDPDNWYIDGDASGEFVNADGPETMDVDFSNNSSMFEWGTETWPNWTRSSAAFVGNTFERVRPMEVFKIGDITYLNGEIRSGSGANAVDLNIGMDIGKGRVVDFEVPLELVNVPNNTGTQAGDADFLKINYDKPPPEIQLYGRPYKVLLAFRNSTDNGYTGVTQFHVFENESASAEVHAVIVTPGMADVLLGMLEDG